MKKYFFIISASILLTLLSALVFVSCTSTGPAESVQPTASVPAPAALPEVGYNTDLRALYAESNPQFVLYEDENQPITMECVDPENESLVFLVMFGVPYAVVRDGFYFYDLTGNGLIDAYSANTLTPCWTLSLFDDTINPANDNCTAMMDEFMALFNGNENPYTSGALRAKVKELSLFDPRIDNGDIRYALFLYYAYVQENTYLDEANLLVLDDLYRSRFAGRKSHPLVTLHLLETMINRGDKTAAQLILTIGLQSAPDFVPFQVYDWQMEQNAAEKERKYQALKTEHPDHWIVVQL